MSGAQTGVRRSACGCHLPAASRISRLAIQKQQKIEVVDVVKPVPSPALSIEAAGQKKSTVIDGAKKCYVYEHTECVRACTHAAAAAVVLHAHCCHWCKAGPATGTPCQPCMHAASLAMSQPDALPSCSHAGCGETWWDGVGRTRWLLSASAATAAATLCQRMQATTAAMVSAWSWERRWRRAPFYTSPNTHSLSHTHTHSLCLAHRSLCVEWRSRL
jgi:hypothetical protein